MNIALYKLFQREKMIMDEKKTASKYPVKKVLRTFTDDKYATSHCGT